MQKNTLSQQITVSLTNHDFSLQFFSISMFFFILGWGTLHMATKTEHSSSQNTRWVLIVLINISLFVNFLVCRKKNIKFISETITEVICHSAGERCGGSMYYSCKQVVGMSMIRMMTIMTIFRISVIIFDNIFNLVIHDILANNT